ncbi:NUDIX domain-containing protein [Candidatus Pacearchaeota archaeon]|nr:NUDIX domain-containing protein [Candidatus Pacearchaeota archaeon]
MKNNKKIDWNKIKKGVFFVISLGIIFNTKTRKILIGRRIDDPYIKNLTWSFPGGATYYGKDLEKNLEKSITEKTGLKVKNLGCVFSRLLKENARFLLMYYLCEFIGGREKPGEGMVELKWVDPEDLEDYFTTSLDPRLKEYVMNLKIKRR